jgi:hypothetical protein
VQFRGGDRRQGTVVQPHGSPEQMDVDDDSADDRRYLASEVGAALGMPLT